MTLGATPTLMAAAAAITIAMGGFGLEHKELAMTTAMQALAGQWEKQTTTPCARLYPARLVLHPDGLYDAPGAADGGAVWHGGDWSATDDRLTIMMANDAMTSYGLEHRADGKLVITDQAACEITYRRA